MSFRLAINRTCAPHLPLAEFIALAVGAGARGVEIRNDIAGKEGADATPAAEIRARLADAGLAVASVNALQRFNDWSGERRAEAEALCAFAAALGAPGIVLCPRHDIGHGWTADDCARNLSLGLRHLRPILSDHGILGYVEPLGMAGSTLSRQEAAVAAIAEIDGWGNYALCHDTFQAFRVGDDRLFPEHAGLVHVSGIRRSDLPPAALTEPDRGLIGEGDRVENLARLRAMAKAGYGGWVSVEPFDPQVQCDPNLPGALADCLSLLAAL